MHIASISILSLTASFGVAIANATNGTKLKFTRYAPDKFTADICAGVYPIAIKMSFAKKKIAPKILAVRFFNNDSEPLSVRK
ncbi:MAG: hypothetical protein WA977_10665 [Halobacteriota archaeon]